jgi:FAD/FMN-containing dehydrogenase
VSGPRDITVDPARPDRNDALVTSGLTTGTRTGPQRAHEEAVDRLLREFRAIPPGEPVRLAKRTSNLFRPREENRSPGLDVSAFRRVLDVDPQRRTADVQGMVTYEQLVDATLPFGLMPTVVPQLKTITIGGAVTGLGIESSSFRNGLPHEGVRDMDILTGGGEIVTARPEGEHCDLFRGFPNSYGTLGYALRLTIDLEPVRPFVRLRHLRFHRVEDLVERMASIVDDRRFGDDTVDFLDGTVFSATECYLTLGSWADSAPYVSDYTGAAIYYRSIRERSTDVLTTRDYLWRWDTDWFWCSRAFGVQNPLVRRLWPRRLKRSDLYGALVRWENRHHAVAAVDRWRGRPPQERVVQDVEIPLSRTADFLEWFLREVPITPIWLCPLRSSASWPLYPLEPGKTYVNVGFWSTVPIEFGAADGDVNRRIETKVAELGGHKSLYSDAYYPPEEFWAHYGGEDYWPVKKRYDPESRLLDLYAKVVKRG